MSEEFLVITVPRNEETLENRKERRNYEIDLRTETLISGGFSYDGESFSLTELAQINWIGLKQADQNDLVSYPFAVTTLDDMEYSLQNKNSVTAFYATGLGTKLSHLGSGRALKQLVNDATTISEVDAVVDNR